MTKRQLEKLLDQHIKQKPGNIVSDMDGEKVMINITNGKYYNLGIIGGRIWEMIDHPTTVEGVINNLVHEYDVEPIECEEQVVAFMDHLYEEGLIGYVEREDNGQTK